MQACREAPLSGPRDAAEARDRAKPVSVSRAPPIAAADVKRRIRTREDKNARPWSKRFQAVFHLLDGRLHRVGAQALSDFTRFADRLIDGAFVVIVESQSAVYGREPYAVEPGGCLRAIPA